MVPLLGSCLSSRMSSHLTPTFRLVGPPRISTRPEASTRKHHIRSLNDILFYSIQRHDLVRSRRAWSILARCPEVDWREMWRIGLLLCGEISSIPEGLDETTDQDRLDYLKVAMLRHPLNRESILQDLVLELISQKRYREALDELELYLPSFPYQDNPVLQLYAGLIFLYQAQPSTTLPTNEPTQEHDGTPKSKVDFANFSKAHLRSAQRHFERARSLDPGNVVAISYLALIQESLQDKEGLGGLVTMNETEGVERVDTKGSSGGNDGYSLDDMDGGTLRARKRLNTGY